MYNPYDNLDLPRPKETLFEHIISLLKISWVTVIIISGMFLPLILTACFVPPEEYQQKVERPRKNLEAFTNNQSIDGHFFLFGGSIGSDPKYTYLYREADGGIRQESTSVDYGIIYEDAIDTPPYVECNEVKISRCYRFINLRYTNVAFHIPPGSIKYDYKMDISK